LIISARKDFKIKDKEKTMSWLKGILKWAASSYLIRSILPSGVIRAMYAAEDLKRLKTSMSSDKSVDPAQAAQDAQAQAQQAAQDAQAQAQQGGQGTEGQKEGGQGTEGQKEGGQGPG
jgi:hypothetical protein